MTASSRLQPGFCPYIDPENDQEMPIMTNFSLHIRRRSAAARQNDRRRIDFDQHQIPKGKLWCSLDNRRRPKGKYQRSHKKSYNGLDPIWRRVLNRSKWWRPRPSPCGIDESACRCYRGRAWTPTTTTLWRVWGDVCWSRRHPSIRGGLTCICSLFPRKTILGMKNRRSAFWSFERENHLVLLDHILVRIWFWVANSWWASFSRSEWVMSLRIGQR